MSRTLKTKAEIRRAIERAHVLRARNKSEIPRIRESSQENEVAGAKSKYWHLRMRPPTANRPDKRMYRY